MKLYYVPGACSLSPHIAAREAGLPLELEKVDLAQKKTASGQDYLAINPKGYVPALVLDNGEVLTEGPAIVQYIADQTPASGLAPANGTLARYRLQEWLGYINSEIHKTFSVLFNKATPEAERSAAIEKLNNRFPLIDAQLAKTPFLLGERFGVADGYLFVTLNWAKILKIDLSAFKNLAPFVARVAARPKVQEALKAEGLA